MDLLDRLLGHDAWTTRQLLERCRTLTDEQLDRDHDIGHRTVRATFSHLIRNMEVWSHLIASVPIPNHPLGENSISALTTRLEVAAGRLASAAREIARRNAWDEKWLDPLDSAEKTYGGCIAHILTHSMHHRAQLLYLLRCVGLKDLPEGDVLSWENRQDA